VTSNIQVKSTIGLTDTKYKEYIQKLHAMVPTFNWTKADLAELKHRDNCPSETID